MAHSNQGMEESSLDVRQGQKHAHLIKSDKLYHNNLSEGSCEKNDKSNPNKRIKFDERDREIEPVDQNVDERKIIYWKNPKITAFQLKHVIPYTKSLKNIGAWEPIHRILRILDENANCPSVRQTYDDIESHEWKNCKEGARCYDILARVSLVEHSLNVAAILIDGKSRQSADYLMQLGRFLILGLSHDLGKIPGIDKKDGYKSREMDHTVSSQRVLMKLLPENFRSRSEILDAVRDHHYTGDGSNPLTKLLKDADQKARQKELQERMADVGFLFDSDKASEKKIIRQDKRNMRRDYSKIDLEWLDIDNLLEMIGAKINEVTNDRKYEAFSCKATGLVYVQPALIFNCVMRLGMQQKQYGIMTFNTSQERKNHVTYAVRKLLDKHVPNQIGDNFIGQKYRIITQEGKRLNPGFYLPIKISAFKISPEEMEHRKQGVTYSHKILQSIKTVTVYKNRG